MAIIDYKVYLIPDVTGYYFSFLMGEGDAQITTFVDSAISVSLGTNARVPDVDRPDNGFWGESLLGKNIGSKLYLLDRSKITDETLKLAEDYAAEALQWLVDDGYLAGIQSISAVYDGPTTGVKINIVYKTVDNEIRRHYYIFRHEGAQK